MGHLNRSERQHSRIATSPVTLAGKTLILPARCGYREQLMANGLKISQDGLTTWRVTGRSVCYGAMADMYYDFTLSD